MRYQAVLLDADDTLLNFSLSQRKACATLFSALGLPVEQAVPAYHEISEGLWRRLEKGELTEETLRPLRFALLFDRFPCGADPVQVSAQYLRLLADNCFVSPDAPALLQYLKRRGYKTAVVSNGFTQVQKRRIRGSGLERWLDAVLISEELGVRKPDPAIVKAALHRLGGVAPQHAVFVGDSLTSDMAAAKNAGVRGVWLDPEKHPLSGDFSGVVTVIGSLPELLPIIEEEEDHD